MIANITQDCSEIVRTLKAVLQGRGGVRLAVLFGSMARGRQHAGSDIDIGVLPECDWTLRDELDLASALTRAVGREVDLVRLDQGSAVLRWEVAQAHVPILTASPMDLPRFLTAAALDHADMEQLLTQAQTRLLRRLAHGQRLPIG